MKYTITVTYASQIEVDLPDGLKDDDLEDKLMDLSSGAPEPTWDYTVVYDQNGDEVAEW